MSKFKEKLQTINLYYPFLLFLLCVAESIFFNKMLWKHGKTLNFIQNIVFVNSLHVVFSYYIIFKTGEGKRWLKKAKESFPYFRLRFVVIFLFFGLCWFFYQNTRGSSYSMYLFFYLMILPRYHEVTQSKGILYCLLVNRENSEEVRTKFPILNKLFLFYFILSSLLSARILLVRNVSFSIDPLYIILGSLFLTMCAIYYIVLRNIKSQQTSCAIYLTRFMIDLLIPYSALASFFSGSIHGVEYATVSSQLITTKHPINYAIIFSFITVAFAWTVFRYPFFLFQDHFNLQNNNILGSLMMGTIASFTFGHYFLDHFMFSARYVFSKEIFLSRLFRGPNLDSLNRERTLL